MSVWDDPELRVGGDYIKFDEVGDTVTGTVVAVRAHRWDDGSVCPQIIINVDGEEKTITAGQVRLKVALAEQRPEPGDLLTVTFTENEKRAGGKTLKHFDVQVQRGNGKAPAKPASKAAPAAAAPSGDYTPEQLEAMKLLGIAVPS